MDTGYNRGLVETINERPGLANVLRRFSGQLEGGYKGHLDHLQYQNRKFHSFSRERLRIITKEGNLVWFHLNRIQRMYLLKKRAAVMAGKRPRYLLLKYRRGGFTTTEQGLSYHQITTKRHQSVMTMAHTKDGTDKIFEIATRFHENDPHAPKKKNSNQKILDFPSLNSKFYFGYAGGDAVGRGDTMQRFHGSEVAWWGSGRNKVEKQRELLSGIGEATSHGEMILETTPNGHDLFYEMYTGAKKGENDWTPIFIPWFMDPDNFIFLSQEQCQEIFDTLTESEKNLILKARTDFGVELTCEHIAWRRQRIADPTVGPLFPQEYPEDDETCWLSAGVKFFDNDDLLKIIEVTPNYERVQLPGGYKVEWKQPEYNKKYIIGADTSEGVGGDPSGLGVLGTDPMEQVAAVHGQFKPGHLADLLIEYSKKYNDALVAVERENTGHAVLESLESKKFPKHLIYHEIKHNQKTEGKAGWSTNQETRPVMLDSMWQWVHDEADGKISSIRDRDMLGECRAFALNPKGKWEHPPGGHDDCIFKWAIAVRVFQMGGKRTAGVIRRKS